MGVWSKPIRDALEHPMWQVSVGIPTLLCAAAELFGGAESTFMGARIGVAHGIAFLGATLIARGALLSIIPKPKPKPQPSFTGAYAYPTFRPVRAPKQLPPPLPDNIIPFERRASGSAEPEIMA